LEIKSTVDEAVGIATEVRGFWSKLFGAKPKSAAAKPVAQAARKRKSM
jgi:hypothetical protein